MTLNTELKDFLLAREAMAKTNYYNRYADVDPYADKDVMQQQWLYHNTPRGRKLVQEYRAKNAGKFPDWYEPTLMERLGGWLGTNTPGAPAATAPQAGAIPIPGTSAGQPPTLSTGVPATATAPPTPLSTGLMETRLPDGTIMNARGGVIPFADGDTVPGGPPLPPSLTAEPDPAYSDQALQNAIGQVSAEYPNWRPPPQRTLQIPRNLHRERVDGGSQPQPQPQRGATGDPQPLHGTLEKALNGAAKFAGQVFFPQGALDTGPTPQSSADGYHALNTMRLGAPDASDVQKFDRMIGRSPQDLDDDIWSVRRLEVLYKIKSETGNTDAANKAAFELVQFSNKVAADWGARALAALQGGDQQTAIANVVRGLNAVPDGYTYSFNRASGRVDVHDQKTGQKVGDGYPVNGQAIYRAIMGLQSDLPWQMLNNRVATTMQDRTHKQTPLQEELTRAQIDLARARAQRVRAGGGGRGGGAPAALSPGAQAIIDALGTIPSSGGRRAAPTPQPAPTPPGVGVDAADLDAMHGYQEGGPVRGTPPFGFDPDNPTGVPSSQTAAPLPNPMREPESMLTRPAAGAQSEPAGMMLFAPLQQLTPDQRLPAPYDDPNYSPEVIPNVVKTKRGNVLETLPSGPEPVPAYPYAWTQAQEEARMKLERMKLAADVLPDKRERALVQKAVQDKLNFENSVQRQAQQGERQWQIDHTSKNRADFDRRMAEEKAALHETADMPYTGPALANLRQNIQSSVQNIIDQKMATPAAKAELPYSVYNDKNVSVATRDDIIMNLMKFNRMDPQAAANTFDVLMLAGSHPRERNYAPQSYDANGRVMIRIPSTGDIVHLPTTTFDQIRAIVGRRTQEGIARRKQDAQDTAGKEARDKTAWEKFVQDWRDVNTPPPPGTVPAPSTGAGSIPDLIRRRSEIWRNLNQPGPVVPRQEYTMPPGSDLIRPR